ncbi:MAG TPA: hypothetical protein VK528_06160, partial [Flavobacterium sp.]|nr:hypothetical protein [Flavobacterium sp.]
DLKDQPAKDKELQKLTGRFSKVTSITTIKAQAKLDSAIAVFDTPIVLRPAQSDSTKTESFERVGTVWEDWFCANYRIDNKGIILTQVTGDISVTTVTGFKRKWFLGKTTAVTDVTPTSKNVTVLQIQSTEVIVPRTWWKEIASFAIGAYAGYQLKN